VKVIVFGSRGWNEPETIRDRLAQLPPGSTIVHGASRGGGADAYADFYGRLLGHTVIPVPVNDDDRAAAKTRRQAPIMRNVRMAAEHSDADHAIGFWDGKSPGSRNMRNECDRHRIPVEIVSPVYGSTDAPGDAAYVEQIADHAAQALRVSRDPKVIPGYVEALYAILSLPTERVLLSDALVRAMWEYAVRGLGLDRDEAADLVRGWDEGR